MKFVSIHLKIVKQSLQYALSRIKMPLKQYKKQNVLFANEKKLLNLLHNLRFIWL